MDMVECSAETLHNGALLLNTGRCGSTLLADLLNQHPATASIQEFFSSLNRPEDAFRPGEVTGLDFWEMINEPNCYSDILHRIDRLPGELKYSLKNHPAGAPLNLS